MASFEDKTKTIECATTVIISYILECFLQTEAEIWS